MFCSIFGQPLIKFSMKDSILKNLPESLRAKFAPISWVEWETFEEIRLRANKPLSIEGALGRRYLSDKGGLTEVADEAHVSSLEEISKTLELMSESSVYAFLEEIKQGFLTINGGHRIGICGKVVAHNGNVSNVIDFSGLNIRIAKEIIGISDDVVKENALPENTLIVSPPNCGKTTMLRDIARRVGDSYKVGIVDERGEIAGVQRGIAQCDVGIHSDVLNLCPKAIGINMLIRSMSPEVIVVDEIATDTDLEAVKDAIDCGVRVIASVHGGNLEDVKKRMPTLADMFTVILSLRREKGRFTHDKIIRSSNSDFF